MAIKLTRTKDMPSVQQISAVEAALGISLPTEIKSFIADYNGCTPEPNDILVNGVEYGINRFIPLNQMLSKKRSLDEFNRSSMLPIATDGSGNLFCLQTAVSDYGKIYFADHEIEGDDAFTLLFNDLESLLSAANPVDQSKVLVEPSQATNSWINPKFLPPN